MKVLKTLLITVKDACQLFGVQISNIHLIIPDIYLSDDSALRCECVSTDVNHCTSGFTTRCIWIQTFLCSRSWHFCASSFHNGVKCSFMLTCRVKSCFCLRSCGTMNDMTESVISGLIHIYIHFLMLRSPHSFSLSIWPRQSETQIITSEAHRVSPHA